MPEADVELVADVRASLRAEAEPERAVGAQRYMKSAMPFLGVRLPIVRGLVRETLMGVVLFGDVYE